MGYVNLLNRIATNTNFDPISTAIEFGGQSVTYQQLQEDSYKIANFFHVNSINKDQNKIAMIMDSSPLLIKSLLGTLKAGDIFIPIDPALPEKRILYMLQNVDADFIVTVPEYLEKVLAIKKAGSGRFKIFLPGLSSKNDLPVQQKDIFVLEDVYNGSCLEFNYKFRDKCYIYFTSGSTGAPKGVLGSHRGLSHFIEWEINHFGFDNNCRVGQLTNPSFDPFLRDIFVPLCAGGTLCIPRNKKILLDRKELLEWISGKKISLIHIVPSVFRMTMLKNKSDCSLENLKYIFLAGEMLKGSDVQHFYERYTSATILVNLYGPTETTLAKAFKVVDETDKTRTNIPVGRPLDNNVNIYVLNDKLEKCGTNETGEIYIATSMMSYGYYHDIEKTDTVFFKDPFGNEYGGFMYKTGDAGKVLDNGDIECLGRIDNQVKVRGVRIETGEVESVLMKHDLIDEAVVLVDTDENNEKYLAAYLVAGEGITVSTVRDFLLSELPEAMVPERYIGVTDIPLLPNGKVDRVTLRNTHTVIDSGIEYRAPETETEKQLAGLWTQILGVEKIGVDDDFFNLGGHSLKVARLKNIMYETLHVNISVTDLFKHSTIAGLAPLVENSEEAEYTALKPAEPQDYYPATSMQKRLHVMYELSRDDINYNISRALLVDGGLDAPKAEECLRKMVSLHDILRTTFAVVDKQIVQRVADTGVVDLKIITAAESEDLDKLVHSLIIPFDLTTLPLFRCSCITISPTQHLLLFDMHHIISDGISIQLFIDEFVRLYSGDPVAPPELHYKDFAVWKEEADNTALQTQKEYWKNVYSGEIPVMQMPSDFNRPGVMQNNGDSIRFELTGPLVREVRACLKKNNSTLFMFLMAAYNVLLLKLTGQGDIILGAPVAGRNQSATDTMLGVFLNVLAIRNNPGNDQSFKDFLKAVSSNVLHAFDNQDYQFEDLVEELNIPRDLSRNPLFDIMLVVNNMQTADLAIPGLSVQEYPLTTQRTKYDIVLNAYEKSEQIAFSIEYCTDLFSRDTIQRHVELFRETIKSVVQNDELLIRDIDILPEHEKYRLLTEYNETTLSYPKDMSIPQLFKQQVKDKPDRICCSCGDVSITYAELDRQSDLLAVKLKQSGVLNNDVVGLVLDRSVEMLTGIMGILKAGAAYLPVDIEFPAERITYMLENSGTKLVVSTKAVIAEMELSRDYIDIHDCLSGQTTGPVEVASSPGDLAYVIYTSGSTGRPKGVMIEHQAVVNFVYAMHDLIRFDTDEKVLCLTTVSFDIFVLETLLPLVFGLTIVMANRHEQKDMKLLHELVQREQVTTFQGTPTRINMLGMYDSSFSILKDVNKLIIGGEEFPDDLLKKLQHSVKATLYNVYGPTETTVWSTLKDVTHAEQITIGKPIGNTQVYVLDEYLKLKPPGVPGDLYIGGDGLARGYMANDKLTRERFVAGPFDGSPRIYKTGDIACWLPGGELAVMGRDDFQVKIRGHRIELTEIDIAVKKYAGILDCISLVRESQLKDKYICAYYIADKKIDISALRDFLFTRLPHYMVPEDFIAMEEFPQTPNGKIDRKRFPQRELNKVEKQHEISEPETESGKKVLKIWQELLQHGSIGQHDNFFELGGNSLLVVLMQKELELLYPGRISAVDIFENPTVFKLAAFLEKQTGNNSVVQGIPFPEEFFAEPGGPADRGLLKLVLAAEEKETVEQNAAAHNCDTMVILNAIMLYVIGEAANRNSITIYISNTPGSVIPLTVDFTTISELSALINAVRQGLTGTTDMYITGLMPGKQQETGELSVLVRSNGLTSSGSEKLFDLIFEIRINEDDIELLCEIINMSLNTEKIAAVVEEYYSKFELVNKILEKQAGI